MWNDLFGFFVRLALNSNTLEKSTLRAKDDDGGNDNAIFFLLRHSDGWLASPEMTPAIRDEVCFGDGYMF